VRLQYRSEEEGMDAVVHCDFAPQINMGEVHKRTEATEQALRENLPQLRNVVIHAEPR
jgi:divalent metal cation (Fe/Co/Zn/Cd) transporter